MTSRDYIMYKAGMLSSNSEGSLRKTAQEKLYNFLREHRDMLRDAAQGVGSRESAVQAKYIEHLKNLYGIEGAKLPHPYARHIIARKYVLDNLPKDVSHKAPTGLANFIDLASGGPKHRKAILSDPKLLSALRRFHAERITGHSQSVVSPYSRGVRLLRGREREATKKLEALSHSLKSILPAKVINQRHMHSLRELVRSRLY